MNTLLIITTTVATKQDAQLLASTLVAQKLAACVQLIGPIESTYFWENTIQTEQEFHCQIKTTWDKKNALLHHLQEHHPYTLPEVLIAEQETTPAFYDWVKSTTQAEH